MIILRQKNYTEEGEGMSKGKKVALGLGATALAAGTAFAGAKGGMFGGRAQVATNIMWGNAGRRLNSTRMMNSAGAGIKRGTAVQAINSGASKKNAIRAGQFAENSALQRWNGGQNIKVGDAVRDTSSLAKATSTVNIAKY